MQTEIYLNIVDIVYLILLNQKERAWILGVNWLSLISIYVVIRIRTPFEVMAAQLNLIRLLYIKWK